MMLNHKSLECLILKILNLSMKNFKQDIEASNHLVDKKCRDFFLKLALTMMYEKYYIFRNYYYNLKIDFVN